MQQTFPCPGCGLQNVVGQAFCGACGHKLQHNCLQCGVAVSYGLRFCPNCGAGLYRTIPARSSSDRSYVQGSKWDLLKPSGRFSRLQFALFYFIPILITVVLASMLNYGESFLPVAIGTLTYLWAPLQIYVVIVAGIRRLHDLNHSGWYLLLAFIPLVNVVMLLYLLFAPGRTEGNRWLK